MAFQSKSTPLVLALIALGWNVILSIADRSANFRTRSAITRKH